MIDIYDNGTSLIGTKKDIVNYSNKVLKEMKEVGDDYVVETCEVTLDLIKEYNDDDILFINYDSCLGLNFDVRCWKKEDRRIYWK